MRQTRSTSPKLLELKEISGTANPMYLFSQKRFIPNFDFDETREMINRLGFFMGLSFSPQQIAKMHSDYGGHPFFIRQVCSQVHKLADTRRPKNVPDATLEKAMERFQPQLDSYLKDILENLGASYPEEYDLLGTIASGDSGEITEYALEAPDLIDHLTGYGVIEVQEGNVAIRFNALRTAIRRAFNPTSHASQWVQITDRRNSLEVDLRRQIFVLLRSQSSIEWSALLQKCVSKSRWENLEHLELREIFGKDSPLYFSDLIGIVRNSDLFEYLGDQRPNVLASMQRINVDRVDAHGKYLSQESFDQLLEDFDYLEEMLQL